MSKTESKWINLPFMASNRSQQAQRLTPSQVKTQLVTFLQKENRKDENFKFQFSSRDVEANKVIAGNLRKLKTMRKKWFVLYSSSDEYPSHLEYHDNERKWREGQPPKRDIVLPECLNICKKQDTRDSKNKMVVGVYTLDDCLSILFEEEAEMKTWLTHLLSHQRGKPPEDGRMPRPNFENMWQVRSLTDTC